MDYLQINELYHHGIKGQKWGVRRELDDETNGVSSYKNDNQEASKASRNKKIKIGATIAGTILAAAGATAFLVYRKKNKAKVSAGVKAIQALPSTMSLIIR